MFTSKFSKRFLKWVNCEKQFIVNLELKIGERYTFIQNKVSAHTRNEAIEKARILAKKDIQFVYLGSKCLGRVKKIKEF